MSVPVRIWLIVAALGIALALFVGIGYSILLFAALHWVVVLTLMSPSTAKRLLRMGLEGDGSLSGEGWSYRKAHVAFWIALAVIWSGISAYALLNVNIALIRLCALLNA